MFLVTGATGQHPGNVGRQVAKQLVEAGHPVRALVRDRPDEPRPSTARPPAGIGIVAGDLSKPSTLSPAFEGVEGIYLIAISDDDVLDPDTATRILARAKEAGVRRVVLLSADGMPLVEVEEPLFASGLEWTVLRPGEFNANTADYWARSIREEGVVRDAYLDVVGTPIHEADIAAVAVAALVGDGHAGAIYTLSGPEAITRREQVRCIGAALGRDIEIVDMTPDERRAAMRAEGWPDDITDHLFGFFAEWAENPPRALPTVERVTGRPGRTFAEWCAEHVSIFR
ncbi:NAD(P)H-binding protein [Spirillospora sp. NPDC050679]